MFNSELKKLKPIFWVIHLFFLFSYSFLKANDCTYYLFDSKVPTHRTMLPAEFIEVLKTHRINNLSHTIGGGKGYAFNILHYAKDGIINRSNIAYLGETNQADFTAKVMQKLFPLADFPHNPKIKENITKGQIYILIQDSYYKHDNFMPFELSMPLIKSANPLISEEEDGLLKSLLSLSPEDKVVSVYGTLTSSEKINGGGNNTVSPNLIVSSILEADIKVALVVLSRQSGRYPEFDLENLKNSGVSVYFLSEILENKRSSLFLPAVILNDTTGRMPLIYGSADLAFSIGPVNFFEGLLHKIPTIILQGELNGYSKHTFFKSVSLAKKTNGALFADNLENIAELILKAEMIDQSQILPAYLIKDIDGQNSVVRYLDRLYEIVTSQLK